MKFLNYNDSYLDGCLKLFDENCPQYFAENEREGYVGFLESDPYGYFVGVDDGCVVSAFGVINNSEVTKVRLSWILVSSKLQGGGVGIEMMNYAKETAIKNGALAMDIAASHLSAPFFAKFGAVKLNKIQDGWGLGIHRIDMEIKL